MSKNEMISMIETMNNYDDLASKAKAKADAIREAIKEEMVRQNAERRRVGCRGLHRPFHQCDLQPFRQHHLQASVC